MGRSIEKFFELAEFEVAELVGVLFDQATGGRALLKSGGSLLACNKELERITGYSEGELVAMNVLELVAETDRSKVAENHKRRVETGEARSYIINIITKEKKKKPVLLSASKIGFSDLFIASMEDIHDRLVHQSIFETLFKLPNAGNAIIARNLRLVDCNNEFERILGYTKSELMYMPLEKLVYPSFLDVVNNNHDTRFVQSSAAQTQYQIRLNSSEAFEKWIELHVERIPNTEYLYLTIRDISQEKNYEELLMDRIQERDNFRDALNHSALVSITDIKGKIIFVNEKFSQISGFPKEELIGNNHRIINSGFHDKSFWSQMWKTVLSGQSWRGEVKNITKNGEYYWVDTTINPIKDKKGRIYELMSIRYLITERKELEERQKSILADLEEYAFLTSHELRGPLARILGLIGLFELQDSMTKQETNDILSRIKDSGKELDMVISSMSEILNRTK